MLPVSYFQTHLSPLSLYFKHLLKINSLTDLAITLNLLYCYGASSLNPRQNFFWLLLDSTWPLSESLAWVKEKREECRAEPRRRATPRLWNSSLPCWNKPLPWFVSHRRKTGIKSNPFSPPEYSNAILELYMGMKRQWLTSKAERCEGCGATRGLRNSHGAWGQQSYIPSEWSMNETELSGAHISSATQI